MARAKAKQQELAPFLSQHSADPDWPLAVAVDAQGRTIYACADCGEEIPDGVVVERLDAGGKPNSKGRVVAYSPSRAATEEAEIAAGQIVAGPRLLREVERTVHHDCGSRRG